jgi:hypothetical protein
LTKERKTLRSGLKDEGIKKMILKEGHKSRTSYHPGATEMYEDLKKFFGGDAGAIQRNCA